VDLVAQHLRQVLVEDLDQAHRLRQQIVLVEDLVARRQQQTQVDKKSFHNHRFLPFNIV
jgi:hypothetical protein